MYHLLFSVSHPLCSVGSRFLHPALFDIFVFAVDCVRLFKKPPPMCLFIMLFLVQ